MRQSIESFDRCSLRHVIAPSSGRSQSLSLDRSAAVAQPQPLRPRAESLPASVLSDIRYFGMYRDLKHVPPAQQRIASPLHRFDLPDYRKYSAPANLRSEVERFQPNRLRHLDPPAPKPIEYILALNEYEPQPEKLLESIRSFDMKKLRHQRTAVRSPRDFARWRLLMRQVEIFRRARLRHVLPDRRPCYPLYLDAKDSDEWWQKTFFAGRERLARFVLHAKSLSESRFAIIGNGIPQTITIPKPTLTLEKEQRVPIHTESTSAIIATETQNMAGLA